MRTRRFVIAAAQSCSIKGDIESNARAHVEMVRIAAEHRARLVVFPELSLTGYEPELTAGLAMKADDLRLDPLKECSRRCGITIIAGAPVFRPKGKPYIGAWIFSPRRILLYRKRHLHPGEERFFSEGTGESQIIFVDGVRVGTAICADINHPSHAETAAKRGAEVYAVGALISESGYAADARYLRQYATEHSMAVLMANHGSPSGGYRSAGRSAVWDEKGRRVAEAESSGPALVLAAMDRGTWSGETVRL
jgi:predicted amidohydrolase